MKKTTMMIMIMMIFIVNCFAIHYLKLILLKTKMLLQKTRIITYYIAVEEIDEELEDQTFEKTIKARNDLIYSNLNSNKETMDINNIYNEDNLIYITVFSLRYGYYVKSELDLIENNILSALKNYNIIKFNFL